MEFLGNIGGRAGPQATPANCRSENDLGCGPNTIGLRKRMHRTRKRNTVLYLFIICRPSYSYEVVPKTRFPARRAKHQRALPQFPLCTTALPTECACVKRKNGVGPPESSNAIDHILIRIGSPENGDPRSAPRLPVGITTPTSSTTYPLRTDPIGSTIHVACIPRIPIAASEPAHQQSVKTQGMGTLAVAGAMARDPIMEQGGVTHKHSLFVDEWSIHHLYNPVHRGPGYFGILYSCMD